MSRQYKLMCAAITQIATHSLNRKGDGWEVKREDKLAQLSTEDAANLLSRYLRGDAQDGRFPDTFRYASFEFCYGYFRRFVTESRLPSLVDERNLEQSSLQLGLYLASWGMYRGSTDLLQRSVRVFQPVLEYLTGLGQELWTLDVPEYKQESVTALIEAYEGLGVILSKNRISATPTLRTKVLLGTLGGIPAFDNYFSRGTGMWKPNVDALMRLKSFYDSHRSMLDKQELRCINFQPKDESIVLYTTAKKLDMIFFQRGLEIASKPAE
jgi:hypothetical protein